MNNRALATRASNRLLYLFGDSRLRLTTIRSALISSYNSKAANLNVEKLDLDTTRG